MFSTAKFHGNFKYSAHYKRPKDGGPTFTILHYAGAVSSVLWVEFKEYLVYTLPGFHPGFYSWGWGVGGGGGGGGRTG